MLYLDHIDIKYMKCAEVECCACHVMPCCPANTAFLALETTNMSSPTGTPALGNCLGLLMWVARLATLVLVEGKGVLVFLLMEEKYQDC